MPEMIPHPRPWGKALDERSLDVHGADRGRCLQLPGSRRLRSDTGDGFGRQPAARRTLNDGYPIAHFRRLVPRDRPPSLHYNRGA